MNEIKNLLFDFGGVFYQISPEKSKNELLKLQIPVTSWINKKNNIFFQFEKGELSADEFLRLLQVSSALFPDFSAITDAFNLMLLGCPLENVRMLARFSKHYHCFLLSNTNIIHYEKFSTEIKNSRLKSKFYQYFSKEYYSFEMGMRKPEAEIFTFILRDSGIKPEETLFVDDDLQNILTAASLKFQCYHFGTEGNWIELINKFDLKI